MGATAPTVTDAALVMGILAPDRFLGGRIPLDRASAVAAFESLDTTLPVGERVRQAWLIGLHNIADGVADLAVRRGLDARDHSLVAFGAAGPMLLPSLLDVLPLESVIVPPNPGGFSAAGLLSADRVFSESRTRTGSSPRGSSRRSPPSSRSSSPVCWARRRRSGRRNDHPELRRKAVRPELGHSLRPHPGWLVRREDDHRDGRRVPPRVRAPQRDSLRAAPRRGRDLPGAGGGPVGQGRVPAAPAREPTSSSRRGRSCCSTSKAAPSTCPPTSERRWRRAT